MTDVIVLNADFSYLNTVTWKEGMCLLFTEKAEMLKESGNKIRTVTEEFFVPMVLRLKRMVRAVYRPRLNYHKGNVFARDEYTCQYCGEKFNGDLKKIAKNGKNKQTLLRLTIDHVVPKARGGKTSYENCVSACGPCNSAKADRTPEEANMKLRSVPEAPSIFEALSAKANKFQIYERLVSLGVF